MSIYNTASEVDNGYLRWWRLQVKRQKRTIFHSEWEEEFLLTLVKDKCTINKDVLFPDTISV